MADSDDEDSGDEGVGLTGFLFGNIDDSGRLEKDSDLFDDESKEHLAALHKLGLGSLLAEVAGGGEKCEKRAKEKARDHDGSSSSDDDGLMFDDDDNDDRKREEKQKKDDVKSHQRKGLNEGTF
jgi:hypothetical protein